MYPVKMIKGDAFTPERFWGKENAVNDIEEQGLKQKGFVRSNNQEVKEFVNAD